MPDSWPTGGLDEHFCIAWHGNFLKALLWLPEDCSVYEWVRRGYVKLDRFLNREGLGLLTTELQRGQFRAFAVFVRGQTQ